MAKFKNKRDILSELFAMRSYNIKQTLSWSAEEIQEQLKRTKIAKEGFLYENPSHDLRIIDEQIDQLEEALKIKESEL